MPVGTETEKKDDEIKEILDEQQLVLFKIANEEFGVKINEVKEIIRWEEVTRIPNSEAYIKGVINLRGNIIVVNDLAMKLGLPSKEIDDDTRIIVVEVKDNTVGMIVDSATEVMRLEGEKIRDAPSMITSGIDHNYIDGVGLLDEKRLLTLLDLAKVLESKDFEKIMQAQRTAERNINKIKDVKRNEGETGKNVKNTNKPAAKTEMEENKPGDNKPGIKTEEKPNEEPLMVEELVSSDKKTEDVHGDVDKVLENKETEKPKVSSETESKVEEK